MKWNINKSLPICPQICEFISLGIVNEKLKPGEKINSVRELALMIGVNPNTVQKSYDILEESGIIYSVRGSGWYVSSDITKAKEVVRLLVFEKTKSYIDAMKQLGFDFDKTLKYLKESFGDLNE